MRKFLFFLSFLFLFSTSLNAKTKIDKAYKKRTDNSSSIKKFTLYSPDIYENRQIREEQVYNGFGCNGKNISPKLIWQNAPKETKSFAITMQDRDMQSGSGWWHWVVYNIPYDATMINNGASGVKKLMPKKAVEVLNDYGFKGYGGVCFSDNKRHNYVITIYALSVEKVEFPRNVMPAMVSLYLNENKLSSATIKAYHNKSTVNKSGTLGNIKSSKVETPKNNILGTIKSYKIEKSENNKNIENKKSDVKLKKNIIIEEK